MTEGLLEGKRLLLTGLLTRHSIAYATAQRAQEMGADLLLTSFGRSRRLTERTAASLPVTPDVLELDARRPEDFTTLAAEVEGRWDRIDGVLHAIAFAPPDAVDGGFQTTSRPDVIETIAVSAVSLRDLTVALSRLLCHGKGASVVGLGFDARVAWPGYDWMGVAKATLESISRYLARDFGEHGVRVNLISAGPIQTTATSAFSGFDELGEIWRRRAPLAWDVRDASVVADPICFLLSDLARGMSGEVLHVDGGYHALGASVADHRDAVEAGNPRAST